MEPALARASLAARGRVHLLGLVSDGGVHSHISHAKALAAAFAALGQRDIFFHALLDGRDTPPESGAGYVADLQASLDSLGAGRIASLIGRFYAMDRGAVVASGPISALTDEVVKEHLQV